MQGNNRDSAMGATTEGIHSPTRHSSTHRRVTPVVITAMTRCETPQMPLHHVKCFGGLTVLTTNTLTARGMAGQRQSTRSGPERGMEGPVILHRKIHTTTAPIIAAPIHIRTPARHQTHHMKIKMTGQSTSVPLGRSTTTTAGPRSHSGRNPKSGWREAQLRASCRAVSPPGMATAPPATAGLSRGWCGLPNTSPGANYLPSRTPTSPDVTGRPKRSRTTTTRATACSPRYHPEGEVSTGASKLGPRDRSCFSISRPSDC
uniref:Uncharacterized protein n=1 Tax=Oncorhynchus tshawytscha TaxID=74940 RepID=A0AAZ3PDL5_ONCTS